jgi:hypothetical protein
MLRQCGKILGFVPFAAYGRSDTIIVSVKQGACNVVTKSLDLIASYLRPACVIADD